VSLQRDPVRLVGIAAELIERKSSGSDLKKLRLKVVGTRCADHATQPYPQKLALTSPTSGGRQVGIVTLLTISNGVSVYKLYIYIYIYNTEQTVRSMT
jgi:hypothetical protein